MVPQAILFDLDETLIDRTQSIVCYAERLQRDFADHLAPTTASTIAATIVAADERGYVPVRNSLRISSSICRGRHLPRFCTCTGIGRRGFQPRLWRVRGLERH